MQKLHDIWLAEGSRTGLCIVALFQWRRPSPGTANNARGVCDSHSRIAWQVGATEPPPRVCQPVGSIFANQHGQETPTTMLAADRAKTLNCTTPTYENVKYSEKKKRREGRSRVDRSQVQLPGGPAGGHPKLLLVRRVRRVDAGVRRV